MRVKESRRTVLPKKTDERKEKKHPKKKHSKKRMFFSFPEILMFVMSPVFIRVV